MPRPRVVLSLLFVLLMAALGLQPAVLHLGSSHRLAQSAPKPNWLPADKQGFGTSRTRASKVWFTLEGGGLSEVYYPRLDTPSLKDLAFVVDGTDERGGTVQRTVLAGPGSLTYTQVNTGGHPVEQPSVVACRYVRKCG